MALSRFAFVALGSIFAVVACAPTSDDAGGVTAADDITSGFSAEADDLCTAKLRFLQKDAYKEGAGRSNDFWPPHTTTVLDVTCQTKSGAQTMAPFEANHGTKPDAKDAKGNPILVEAPMADEVVTASAPWRDMQKLVASFGSCECQDDAFLTLDQVSAGAGAIVNEIASLLSCEEPTAALLQAVKDKKVDDVKRIIAGCKVKSDLTPADLEKAASNVESAVKTTLVGKHVCNNDALLQGDLFARFRDTRDATACNPNDKARCTFPKLFFRPAREVK